MNWCKGPPRHREALLRRSDPRLGGRRRSTRTRRQRGGDGWLARGFWVKGFSARPAFHAGQNRRAGRTTVVNRRAETSRPGRRPTRPFGDRPGRSRPRRSPNGLAGHKPRRRRAVTPRRSLAIAGKERSAAEQRPLGLGRWRGNRPDLTARRRRGLAATGRRSERPSPDQPRLKEGAQSTE